MADLQTFRLDELAAPLKTAFATGPFGSSVSAKNFRPTGVPMVRGSNLSVDVGVRLIDADYVYLSEEKAGEFSRSLVSVGDLIFTCWGTIGQIGLVDSSAHYDRYIISNKQMKMTPDPERVDPLFLYYYLSQPSVGDAIRSQTIGSSVPGFNLGQLQALTVELPELPCQREISVILNALDRKMAHNRALVDGLEGVAASLAGSMLLDHGVPLSETARFVNGKAFTKGASGVGKMVVRIAELNSGPGASTVYNSIDVEDDFLAKPGDLLFSWSGSLVLHRWFYPEAIVNQHIFKVIPKTGFPKWLVAQLITRQLEYFRGIAADKATTMGHIQRRHLDEPVEVPSAAEIARHDPLMTALWERALAAEQESLTLAALRDTLLPALMSGRLSVRDAEAAVSEVV